MLNEYSTLRHPTKKTKVNRSGEYRPGENGFRPSPPARSEEPCGYNLRKQQEISADANKRRTGFVGRLAALGVGNAALRGGAAVAGGAATAYTLGAAGQLGAAAVAAGAGGVARAGAVAAASPLKRALDRTAGTVRSGVAAGTAAAFEATGGATVGGTAAADTGDAALATAPARDGSRPPDWARRLRRDRHLSHGTQVVAHAVRSGDGHDGGASVSLSESDRA